MHFIEIEVEMVEKPARTGPGPDPAHPVRVLPGPDA